MGGSPIEVCDGCGEEMLVIKDFEKGFNFVFCPRCGHYMIGHGEGMVDGNLSKYLNRHGYRLSIAKRGEAAQK